MKKAKKPKQLEVNLSCSFCAKAQRDVQKLIAGPGIYICDECVRLCDEIIASEQELKDGKPVLSPGEPSQRVRLEIIARTVREVANDLRNQWISARPDVVQSVLTLADHLESIEGAVRAEAKRTTDWVGQG